MHHSGSGSSAAAGEPANSVLPVPKISGATDSSAKNGDADSIIVRGARVHNLKNIDCSIPHNRLTVVTGLSGSGKSSLAFDTLYAEGQRRYIESLSAYARQFLERMQKPDVDEVLGIAPPVAIRQKNTTRNPRSTVATATEIYDYLRLLFARVGTTTCYQCGEVVRRDHVDDIADQVCAMEAGRRFYVLFQVNTGGSSAASEPAGRHPEHSDASPQSLSGPAGSAELRRSSAALRMTGVPAHPPTPPQESLKPRLFALRQHGFNRLYQDGRVFEFSTPESLLEVDFSAPVYVLVDRLALAAEVRQRLIDSVELCFREAGEAVLEFLPVESGSGGARHDAPEQENNSVGTHRGVPVPLERLVFSGRFECKRCKITFQAPEPSLFSFNNPYGACPRCQGFGNTIDFDMNLVIPDKNKTLAGGAIDPWTKPRYRVLYNDMKRAARAKGIPLDVPYFRLAPEERTWLLEGDDSFPGIRGFFDHLERKKYKLHVRVFLSRYRGYTLCPECQGGRLRREALHVLLGGKNITDVCRMSIQDAYPFFNELQLSPEQQTVADKVLEEIRSRLKFLYKVGLEYLTLDRLASTLSGGESQRIQLATALGSNLVGALYVLDEPSIGLHPRDTGRLIEILKTLRDLGNTVLVVEHDEQTMRAADHIVDLGPGAGEHGGRIVAQGTALEIELVPESLTGQFLSGAAQIAVPARRRTPSGAIEILGAAMHNLRNIDVRVPLGTLTCVTGVSGSGKSTLVNEILLKAGSNKLHRTRQRPGTHRELRGREAVEALSLGEGVVCWRWAGRRPLLQPKMELARAVITADAPGGQTARCSSRNVADLCCGS